MSRLANHSQSISINQSQSFDQSIMTVLKRQTTKESSSEVERKMMDRDEQLDPFEITGVEHYFLDGTLISDETQQEVKS
jgi:hypothetical protein